MPRTWANVGALVSMRSIWALQCVAAVQSITTVTRGASATTSSGTKLQMETGLMPRRSLTAQPLCPHQTHPFGWICEKLSRCSCILLLQSAAR